jgi:hypothetical protein
MIATVSYGRLTVQARVHSQASNCGLCFVLHSQVYFPVISAFHSRCRSPSGPYPYFIYIDRRIKTFDDAIKQNPSPSF